MLEENSGFLNELLPSVDISDIHLDFIAKYYLETSSKVNKRLLVTTAVN